MQETRTNSSTKKKESKCTLFIGINLKKKRLLKLDRFLLYWAYEVKTKEPLRNSRAVVHPSGIYAASTVWVKGLNIEHILACISNKVYFGLLLQSRHKMHPLFLKKICISHCFFWLASW